MTIRSTIALALGAAATASLAFTAQASDSSNQPLPLPMAKIAQVMEAAGYTVTEVEMEDGAIEAEGMKDGQEWEVIIDAKTGEIVSAELDD